jgi:hypothetical protein
MGAIRRSFAPVSVLARSNAVRTSAYFSSVPSSFGVARMFTI